MREYIIPHMYLHSEHLSKRLSITEVTLLYVSERTHAFPLKYFTSILVFNSQTLIGMNYIILQGFL